MDQPELFHESLTEALQACVRALGGNKMVGHVLWPEKGIEAARIALLDALNPDRPNKLSPDQVLLILRESRRVGCHAGITYLARECGYTDPKPIEPEDERAALMREFNAQVKALRTLTTRMDRAGVKI